MHVRRTMFHWEFPDDGGAAAPAAAPAAEAGAVPPAEPAPASAEPGAGLEGQPSPEAAAPAWANDPAFHDAVADTAAQVAQAMFERFQQQQQPQQAQQQPEPQTAFNPSSFDPWADEFPQALAGAFESLEQRIAQAVQQAVAPLAEQRMAADAEEQQQRVLDTVNAVVQANGDWPIGDNAEARNQANQLVVTLAEQLIGAEVQRFGPGVRAAENAIAKAHRQVHALLEAAGNHGQTQYRNQLGSLGGAMPEPAGGAAGFQQPVVEGDELAVARRHAMRSIGA